MLSYNSLCKKFLAYDRLLQDIFIKQIRAVVFSAFRVLIQGWLITADYINSLTQYVEKQLYLLEERVTTITAIVNQQLENLKAESEHLVGRFF